MAKGNMLLGFARGKVGDVVFYRQNGEQVSRGRNKHPHNPNTLRQQVQRAVSASIQRLYSAGQQVFNHSFEGKKVGAENQQEFVRRNMAILRALVVGDINAGNVDAACRGRVSAPGLSVAVPFDGMMISSGSLQQLAFSWDEQEGAFSLPEPVRNESEQITEQVGAYATRVGLVEGDIYTFVIFGCDPLQGSELGYYGGEPYTTYAAVFQPFFAFAQMRVKAGATSDTTVITSSTTLASLFEPAAVGVDLSGKNLVGSSITAQTIDARAVSSVIGCIRSREDSGKRSVSFMHVTRGTYDWGIASNWLSSAWSASSRIAGSDLILDGSDFITPTGLIITPSFTFPITTTNLAGASLTFSDPVTAAEIMSKLTFSVEGGGTATVATGTEGMQLYYDSAYFNTVSLSADGLTLTFGETQGGPTLTALNWQ